MIAADNTGLVDGEVIDVTARGAGLRLTKPLTREQDLTLNLDMNDGTGSLCDVKLVEVQRAQRIFGPGVAFRRMSLEDEVRRRGDNCRRSARIRVRG